MISLLLRITYDKRDYYAGSTLSSADILSTPVALGATPLSPVNRFNDISNIPAMIYST